MIGLAFVLLVGILFALGSLGDDGGKPAASVTPTPAATAKPHAKRHKHRKATPATPKVVSLKLIPEGTVYVCLENAAGAKLIAGKNLTEPTSTYRSKRMRVTFGNGLVKMRVGGKTYGVPDTSDAVGYSLRPGAKPKRLTAGLPSCG